MPIEILFDQPEENVHTVGSHGDGSVAGTHLSPRYPSSETSDHPDEFAHVPLPYPSEIPDDIHPSDSESQSRSHRRHTGGASRAQSGQRPPSRRTRAAAPESPGSVDSAEEYAESPDYGPEFRHRQTYHGPEHVVPMVPYANSSSSGASYVYPPVHGPPSNQVVHYPGPTPGPYGQHYPPIGNPPGPGYHPSPQPYPMNHHSGSHMNPHYQGPQFGGQHMMPYAQPSMFYPSQYPNAYPPPQPPWDHYQRMHPPAPPPPPPPPAAPVPEKSTSPAQSATSNPVDQDEIVRRVEAILLEERKARLANDAEREARAQAAADAATAKAERAASDARIAEESAKKAWDEAIKEAEAKAAVEIAKARAEAEAKSKQTAEEAQRAVHEAKIAETAAAQARADMQKETEVKAAEDAAKAQEAVKATAAQAVRDAQIAKEAADKTRQEIEDARVPVPAPQAKRAPIKFKDAIGRKFNFPFHLCAKWNGMEELIRQAFLHVEGIGPHVQEGRYDLLGPNGEIILPQVWDTVVEPDWTVSMHMWPLPEPPRLPPPPPPPPLADGVLNLDLSQHKKPGKKQGAKKSQRLPPAPPPPPPPSPPLAPPPILPMGFGASTMNATPPLDPLVPGEVRVDKAPKKAGPAKPGTKKAGGSSSFGKWILGGKPQKPPAKALKETKKPD